MVTLQYTVYLHSDSMSTESVEYISSAGEIQYQLCGPTVGHTFNLQSNSNQYQINTVGEESRWEDSGTVDYLAVNNCGNGHVPSSICSHTKS